MLTAECLAGFAVDDTLVGAVGGAADGAWILVARTGGHLGPLPELPRVDRLVLGWRLRLRGPFLGVNGGGHGAHGHHSGEH